MKRLVYAPKIEAFVKADSGVYNLTEYITEFSIDRKINAVSSAELTLRNPGKIWTDNTYRDAITGEKKVGPILHPMDPITIFLTRLQHRPVQVFTGFCDSTPYLQLFPGTVTLNASCTLKKLLYTYFDPGLPFMQEYLKSYGWIPTEGGQITHPQAEGDAAEGSRKEKEEIRYDDSGIGELLYHVLQDIGGWSDSTIFIQEMPPSVIELVSNLFDLFKAQGEEASAELKHLLHEIIGSVALGSGGESSGGGVREGGPLPAHLQQYNHVYDEIHLGETGPKLSQRVTEEICEWAGLPPLLFYQISLGESGGCPGMVGFDTAQASEGLGMWQITGGIKGSGVVIGNEGLIEELGGRKAMLNPIINAKAAKKIYEPHRGNLRGSGAWYGESHVTEAGWAEDK